MAMFIYNYENPTKKSIEVPYIERKNNEVNTNIDKPFVKKRVKKIRTEL